MDVLSLAEEDTRLAKASVREYSGPCPDANCRCKTDGFRVKWNNEQWVFMCRGCWDPQDMIRGGERRRGFGDAIDYLRHYRGMTFPAAQALVKGNEHAESRPAPGPIANNWQSEAWQKKVHAIVRASCDALSKPAGAEALAYARSRGLLDETIKQFQLGYDNRDGIPRLIIPNINWSEKRYVAIYRRDMRADVPKGERWRDAPGGTKSELYLADSLHIRKDFPVVLVEDPFSALSIWQECSDLVNVVATGGAECGKLTKWLVRLALAPRVLIALDADEAGDKESLWWLDRLENAQRLRPLLKDPNDMLQAGRSLREWIIPALPAPVSLPAPEVEPEQITEELPAYDPYKHPPVRCGKCGGYEFQLNLARTRWLCMDASCNWSSGLIFPGGCVSSGRVA